MARRHVEIASHWELHEAFLSEAEAERDARRAAEARGEAERAWMRLGDLDLYRDAFGQPEPRRALFAYALVATQTQFLIRDPAGRAARASAAASFLEERIHEWEQMQRERLGDLPEAELREAFDAIGASTLRRLVEAWKGIENAPIPSVP